MWTSVPFTTYEKSITEALEGLHAPELLQQQEKILIKPNLVNASPPPVTTPVECCAALVALLQNCTSASITIAEGSGAANLETGEIFEALGYTKLARETGTALLDLNHTEVVECQDAQCSAFPRMYLPQVAFESFIISVPVLKAHSLAEMTGSLKNMMGFAPPHHYGHSGGWKKAAFHARMHTAIAELNRYRAADLTIMDASRGLAQFHLGGPECDPPLETILAGWDPLEVDRQGAALLGLDWRNIPHLEAPISLGRQATA